MKIAVIIPAYKVKNQIVELVLSIDKAVKIIYVIDDCCPDGSGKFLQENIKDDRLKVLFHEKNQGVGGAMITGYRQFLNDEQADIAVKLDGDGQMNPSLIKFLVKPIVEENAEYVKGNRFFNISGLHSMPKTRLFGNSMLSLINKFVNGYWHIMDPTNGFTAIHKSTLEKLELSKIDKRYFFESDMLFRLGINRAIVIDFPMNSVYDEEESNLKISRILFEFPPKYLVRFFKRIFYNYFLRDFNAGTIQLFLGAILFTFGSVFGLIKWIQSINTGIEATAGTIMLAALPIILGFQFLLGFLNYDIQDNTRTK